ncbi:fibroblast growth factor receptor 1-like [Anneissia japonica]|uniref:fibroblast growth factor receptor 1-like n=1 Tax=Anneissia japonica TaxID=1529436 RepID=UPI00142554E7|nr:fibroblast growth factor receptor 1-like [Anneissia japonica]
MVKLKVGSLLKNGTASEIKFETFIEFGEWTDWRPSGPCPCNGFINYTRSCQPQELYCQGNDVEERACQISDKCSKLTEKAIIIAGAILIIIFILLIAAFVLKRYRYGSHSTSYNVDPAFKDHEICLHTHVVWDERKPIGNGRFGMVYSCPLIEQDGRGRRKLVAIKTPLETASAAEKMDFKKEIQLMSQIGKHNNVIELIGCRTTEDPMYIITPLMQYGCLLELLRKSSKMKKDGVYTEAIYDLKLKDLFSIGRQIAIGMEYISSLKIVHGDLAARNILIGEGLVAKIGDFGLGQDAYEKGYLRLKDGEVPVKWYSLETLTEQFMTPMSDV